MTDAEKIALRTELADLCHEQWSGWMRYLFSKCLPMKDGSYFIPKWAVKRWNRQMNTQFVNLPANEQESDYVEADKFLAVFNNALKKVKGEDQGVSDAKEITS